MQEIIILAGANGAGKTAFANEYLPAAEEGLVFVNADEIAREPVPSALPGSRIYSGGVVGSAMKRNIDLAKVEAALKRAARAATHGDREARSGRFIQKTSDRRLPQTNAPKRRLGR